MAFKHSRSFKRCATVCILVVSSLVTAACSVTPSDEQTEDYSETTESADQSVPAYEPSLEGLLGRVGRINSNKLVMLPHTPQLSAPLKAKLTAQIKAIKKAGANVGILMIDTEPDKAWRTMQRLNFMVPALLRARTSSPLTNF